MNQTVLIAIIGVSGAIIGASLTFLGTLINANLKIKEIQLTHTQELDDKYLANARLYISTLYLPINISLSKLESRYYDFKTRLSLCDVQSKEFRQALEEFREVCDEYVKQHSQLRNQGMDAYLTNKLDVSLRSFNNFIKNSRNVEKHSIELTSGLRVKFFGFEQKALLKENINLSEKKEAAFLMMIEQIPLLMRLWNLLTIPFKYHLKVEILAAPFYSLEFERRMTSDIPKLKSFIKEVTLGTIPLDVLHSSE